eukprot:TRINITY_DN4956_c0_g2_i17.p1 TRINITY_DN4956_c0_g2~~TRINITY_DN4956_c0_g2_i17.p1  ORF type:complete len:455 (-),score=139.36 TRINITY_DN4956_c0_g2_i17:315-1679(-)
MAEVDRQALLNAMRGDGEVRKKMAMAVGLAGEMAQFDFEDLEILEDNVLTRMKSDWNGAVSNGTYASVLHDWGEICQESEERRLREEEAARVAAEPDPESSDDGTPESGDSSGDGMPAEEEEEEKEVSPPRTPPRDGHAEMVRWLRNQGSGSKAHRYLNPAMGRRTAEAHARTVVFEGRRVQLSMEQFSVQEQHALRVKRGYKQYMANHPELRQLLTDFIAGCLAERPVEICKFARCFFENNMPQLKTQEQESEREGIRLRWGQPEEKPQEVVEQEEDQEQQQEQQQQEEKQQECPVVAPPEEQPAEKVVLTPEEWRSEQERVVLAVADGFKGVDGPSVGKAVDHYLQLDANGDGRISVNEVRWKLEEWGMDGSDLDAYMRGPVVEELREEGSILPEQFYEWYLDVVGMFQKTDGNGAGPVLEPVRVPSPALRQADRTEEAEIVRLIQEGDDDL